MTAIVSAIASLVTPLIGRSVEVTDRSGDVATYTIAKLSDKIGSLKDGSKGEYVILQRADDAAVVISIHPQHAKRLVTKGEDSGMKLVAEAELSTEEQAAVSEELDEEQSTAEAGAEGELEADAAGETEPAPEAPEAKAPSKKERFMIAFKAGADRKAVKAAVADLGLSDAGFNTYYQNAKSGKWA